MPRRRGFAGEWTRRKRRELPSVRLLRVRDSKDSAHRDGPVTVRKATAEEMENGLRPETRHD